MVGEGNTFTSCINFHLLFYFRFFFFYLLRFDVFPIVFSNPWWKLVTEKGVAKNTIFATEQLLAAIRWVHFSFQNVCRLMLTCACQWFKPMENDFLLFFFGIFAYGAADSRLSTLFRTNGNATADILIAVIKTFPTTDCIYMTIVDYTAIGQSLFDDDQTTNLTHRSRLTAQPNGLLFGRSNIKANCSCFERKQKDISFHSQIFQRWLSYTHVRKCIPFKCAQIRCCLRTQFLPFYALRVLHFDWTFHVERKLHISLNSIYLFIGFVCFIFFFPFWRL